MPQLAENFGTLVTMLEHNAETVLAPDDRRMILDLAAAMLPPIKRLDEIIADAADYAKASAPRQAVRPKPELKLIQGGRI